MTIKTYHHILYATDLGQHEKLVRGRLKAVAGQNNSKISIVHVVESMPVFMDMSGYLNTAEIIERIQVEARSAIKKISKDLEIADGHQHVIVGSPKSCIVELATQIKADLIILGAHSRHLIDNLIGSTTDAVLRTASCDVLAVRYEEK
ncbi:MAG: universal stress protein [Gammaproteobacteria bacterium]|nr:universal stress protein [Gammaproteobacteria bacterium]